MTLLGATESQAVATALFWIFAALTGGSAVAVVVSRNIVRTAVGLMFALVGVAGLYFLLHAEFLAAAQLVVYVGGTLILIIFGVMLTSKSPFSKFEPAKIEVIAAVVLGVVMFGALVVGVRSALTDGRISTVASTAVAGVGEVGSRGQETAATEYPVARLGQALLGDYLIPFELASVVLLAVMIGAAYLAKSRKKESQI